MEKIENIENTENIETATNEEVLVPKQIDEDNGDVELKKVDVDATVIKTVNMYTTLSGCVIERIKILDTLRPVIAADVITDLEIKIDGLAVNLTKIEKDVDILTELSKIITDLTAKQKEEKDEQELLVLDARLIQEFEAYLYKAGEAFGSLSRLSEYYFTNIQSVIDSLTSEVMKFSNALKESNELSSETVVDNESTAEEKQEETTNNNQGE